MAPLRVPAHETKASCWWSLTAAVAAARLRDALPAVSSGPRAGTGPRGMWHHTTPLLSEPEHPVFLTEAPDLHGKPRKHGTNHARDAARARGDTGSVVFVPENIPSFSRNVQRARHIRGDSSV